MISKDLEQLFNRNCSKTHLHIQSIPLKPLHTSVSQSSLGFHFQGQKKKKKKREADSQHFLSQKIYTNMKPFYPYIGEIAE